MMAGDNLFESDPSRPKNQPILPTMEDQERNLSGHVEIQRLDTKYPVPFETILKIDILLGH